MRITSKGQVTIPADIRERAGLLPNTEVEFDYDGKTVTIARAKKSKKPGRGEALVAHLRRHPPKHFRGMNTDEIMKLLRGE
jgi:AbrB family looped-hinge helix DNA binding protein